MQEIYKPMKSKFPNYSDVIEYLSDKKVGDVVKIKYLHNGEIIKI